MSRPDSKVWIFRRPTAASADVLQMVRLLIKPETLQYLREHSEVYAKWEREKGTDILRWMPSQVLNELDEAAKHPIYDYFVAYRTDPPGDAELADTDTLLENTRFVTSRSEAWACARDLTDAHDGCPVQEIEVHP